MNDFEAMFAELSSAVRLDKLDLDNQLTEHGELFRQVCDQLALYTAQRDAAKRSLDETEAEVDRVIREDAATSKEKTTETDIKRRMILDNRVIRAKDKLAELTLTVNRLQGLKESYIERRHAFNKLTDLYAADYWNTTTGSRSRVSARSKVEESIKRNRDR